jgi:hypothetical protein
VFLEKVTVEKIKKEKKGKQFSKNFYLNTRLVG